jgi:VanZ family protein
MFSNQKAEESSELSDGLILKTVRIIEKINHKKYSDEEILNIFVKPVRKMAHFTIYLILGILVYIFIDDLNLKNIILISLMVCLIYSISDEIHQLFIEGRTGKMADVLIDTCGSFIGIVIVNKIKKVIHR